MQGFSVKILPAGLEIFTENRRLDLAFPSNPGITFAPRTEMTAWCGSLKGAKMEVNENRGRLCRKKLQGKIRKKGITKRKKTSPEAWKGQTTTKGVWLFSDPTGLVQPGGNNHSSRIARCVWPLVSFMGQADTLCIHFPLPAQKTAKKEKSSGSP